MFRGTVCCAGGHVSGEMGRLLPGFEHHPNKTFHNSRTPTSSSSSSAAKPVPFPSTKPVRPVPSPAPCNLQLLRQSCPRTARWIRPQPHPHRPPPTTLQTTLPANPRGGNPPQDPEVGPLATPPPSSPKTTPFCPKKPLWPRKKRNIIIYDVCVVKV